MGITNSTRIEKSDQVLWYHHLCHPQTRHKLAVPVTDPINPRITINCTSQWANRVGPEASTFYLLGPSEEDKISPCPRKWEASVMARIKAIAVASGPTISPRCEIQHNSPPLLGSAGGYTGNVFHEFDDGFIPLFITHPIIDLDNANSTHCFPSAILGLVSHGFMTIKAYGLKNHSSRLHSFSSPPQQYSSTRPRPVLVVSRSHGDGRVILNQREVRQVGEEFLFYDVINIENNT
ncbi:hypothetical protein Tsubulata_039241 [Turnera subulata]|uniref:Uncharacterized protein n=1 Tax=Turnera subulata TaxID=218843 RepID=A0A9Q0JFT5_9ROSI|nr:hypothetical protein Tsubulata_039241 [Turnera subulata]